MGRVLMPVVQFETAMFCRCTIEPCCSAPHPGASAAAAAAAAAAPAESAGTAAAAIPEGARPAWNCQRGSDCPAGMPSLPPGAACSPSGLNHACQNPDKLCCRNLHCTQAPLHSSAVCHSFAWLADVLCAVAISYTIKPRHAVAVGTGVWAPGLPLQQPELPDAAAAGTGRLSTPSLVCSCWRHV